MSANSAHELAWVFGGPDDGAIREITWKDIELGFFESIDSEGNSFTYQIEELQEPRPVAQGIAKYRMVP